jgi:hypothetical protein
MTRYWVNFKATINPQEILYIPIGDSLRDINNNRLKTQDFMLQRFQPNLSGFSY